jgi:hypothetical protein
VLIQAVRCGAPHNSTLERKRERPISPVGVEVRGVGLADKKAPDIATAVMRSSERREVVGYQRAGSAICCARLRIEAGSEQQCCSVSGEG